MPDRRTLTEDYVRPPIVAFEPPDRKAQIWRFRAVLILLLIAFAVVVFLVARAFVGGGEGSPTVAPLATLLAG